MQTLLNKGFINLHFEARIIFHRYSSRLARLLPMKKRFSVIAPLPAEILTICPVLTSRLTVRM